MLFGVESRSKLNDNDLRRVLFSRQLTFGMARHEWRNKQSIVVLLICLLKLQVLYKKPFDLMRFVLNEIMRSSASPWLQSLEIKKFEQNRCNHTGPGTQQQNVLSELLMEFLFVLTLCGMFEIERVAAACNEIKLFDDCEVIRTGTAAEQFRMLKMFLLPVHIVTSQKQWKNCKCERIPVNTFDIYCHKYAITDR